MSILVISPTVLVNGIVLVSNAFVLWSIYLHNPSHNPIHNPVTILVVLLKSVVLCLAVVVCLGVGFLFARVVLRTCHEAS